MASIGREDRDRIGNALECIERLGGGGRLSHAPIKPWAG